MLRSLFFLPLIFCLFSQPVFAGKMITIDAVASADFTPRIERVLARYNYAIAYKNEGTKKIQIVASNPNDNVIPIDMILELSFSKNFLEIVEPRSSANSIPLQFFLRESITREKYVELLNEIQSLGVHVSKARSERYANFIVQVPENKLDSLLSALRKHDFLDLYYQIRPGPTRLFLQDYKRTGTTSLEVAFAMPGMNETVLARLPAEVSNLAFIKYKTKDQLEAEHEASPPGGIAVITLPRKYALVDKAIVSLEPARAVGFIKMFPPEDYYEAVGDDNEAFIIQPNSGRYVFEPRAEPIFEAAHKLPNFEQHIERIKKEKGVPTDVATLFAGLEALRLKALKYPVDYYGFGKGQNSQKGYTEFLYAEIPPNSMSEALLSKILSDFHIYPLHNDGTPNRSEEIVRVGHKSCEALLTPKK